MRSFGWLVAVVGTALSAAGAGLGSATQASLLLSAQSAKPGETVFAGIRLRMDKGWHTYWRNGGESGKATEVEWTLPQGIQAGNILWPAPKKHVVEGIVSYIYEDEAILLVPLQIAGSAEAGEKEIVAKVSWLECEVSCVPGDATLKARLKVGESIPSPEAGLLTQRLQSIPRAEPALGARARLDRGTNADKALLVVEWTRVKAGTDDDFYPYENDALDVSSKTTVAADASGRIRFSAETKKTGAEWPKEVGGLVIERSPDGAAAAYEARMPLERPGEGTASPEAKGGVEVPQGPVRVAPYVLVLKLLLAFLGGLILNVMPCVLPVIALKILGFVKQSREDPARVRKLGFVYALGVLASFAVLAGVVIAVQQAGRQASWGMQFGNPQFIVVLTVLVALVALNLFGLFEVVLSGRAMNAAAELSGKEGAAGAFFNGVLATALATPCTAPFLGGALGFAFTQSAGVILAMFLAAGAGLAFPYVLLSAVPGWLKWLPKPGAWMERFKVAMGFPMLATAVWLVSLAQVHYGKRILWLGIFLVVVGLCAWIFGEFVQRGRQRRGLALAVVVLLLAGGYGYALEGQLRWRKPPEPEAATGTLQESPEGIPWQPWSAEAVVKARGEGRVVFVDFTADWCVTCQANKKSSIEIASVRARLKELNATALLGDYTRIPPSITSELRRFGRAGVPLVLVYPRDASKPAIVLPELLTPSLVLDALKKADGR